MVSHWSLNDNKSPQVSRTLLSILADLNNGWSPPVLLFPSPLVTVLRAPITIGITIIFMFHIFFISQERFRLLSFFSLSFNFTQWSAGTAKSSILQVLFALLTIPRSGRLAEIR